MKLCFMRVRSEISLVGALSMSRMRFYARPFRYDLSPRYFKTSSSGTNLPTDALVFSL